MMMKATTTKEVVAKRLRIVIRRLKKLGIYGLRYMEEAARRQAQVEINKMYNTSDKALIRYLAKTGWKASEIIDTCLETREALAKYHRGTMSDAMAISKSCTSKVFKEEKRRVDKTRKKKKKRRNR